MTTVRRVVAAAAAAVCLTWAVAGCTAGDRGSPPPFDTSSSGPTATDQADQARVRQTDFQIRYQLEGVTRDSSAVGLVSSPQLALIVDVPEGTAVVRGEILGSVIVEPEVRASLEQGATTSRLDRSRLEHIMSLEGDLSAPVDGIFALGDLGPTLVSPGIDVVVDLTPIQGLRYQSLAFTGRATVETVVGEREVDCEAIWAETTVPGVQEDDETVGTGQRLHCRLPAHVETAAGLRSRLALASQTFPEATVVPNVYVAYDAASDGYVVTVLDDGEQTTIPVDVGVTDGVVRVVTSQLPIGAVLVDPRDATR